MNDSEFDRALVASAFALAAESGWKSVSVTVAARAADLPLDRARGRFLGIGGILSRFGRIADQAALAYAASEGDHRDRLFDLVMRRIDVLQAHRAGVLALREFLPLRPMLSLMLAAETGASMAWLLEASGIPAGGVRGGLRVQGMVVVWLYTLRQWQSDESEDLGATMAALDKALDRAVQVEGWTRRGGTSSGDAAMADDLPLDPDPAPDPVIDPDPVLDADLPLEPELPPEPSFDEESGLPPPPPPPPGSGPASPPV